VFTVGGNIHRDQGTHVVGSLELVRVLFRPFVALVLSTLLGPLAGCGRGRLPEVSKVTVRDLTADLDLAEVEQEPGLIDLGTPEARGFLRKGWSQDEVAGERTFVWSDGPESEIAFFLAAPRDVPLVLGGEPYPATGGPAQEIALFLNGKPAGQTVVAPGGEIRVVLPGRDLRQGANRLVLRYAWTRSPWEETAGKSPDRRRLAVAWDLLRFETGVDKGARVRAAGDRLAIPFGSRLAVSLRLPARAELSLKDLRSRNDESGTLRVSLQPAGGAEREVARLSSPSGAVAIELGNPRAELARVSLTALADKPGGPPGRGLLLRRPVLAAPRPAAVGDTAATRTPAPPKPLAPRHRPRNVIIYLVDALRADHLGCYGYSRPVSPRIDAFARQATLFRHAVAQCSWTRPSVTTVLTGLLPRTHNVHGRRDALAQEALTLAEVLQSHGYRTAGFVTNGNVARSVGLGQGFDTYRLLPSHRSSARDVNTWALEWLETGRKQDEPFFLYLHTVEPHAPYNPPPPFRRRFAAGARDEALTRMRLLKHLHDGALQPTPDLRRDLLDLYDAEIAANDAAFGELVDALVRRGLWEETVVLFLSDHGEEFLDHGGWEHGKTLHTEMLDVPLIVRVPSLGTGKVVDRQAQHVDVVPTILDLLGLSVPAFVEGRSLVPWIVAESGPGPSTGNDEAAFSWLDEGGFRSAAVTSPRWRLIEERAPATGRLLYDRSADPGERNDLAADRPVEAGYLESRLRAAERPKRGALHASRHRMDPETRKQLQALGYAH
jgi:choline-sulfatase